MATPNRKTYASLDEVKQDIVAFGFKFQQIKKYPTQKDSWKLLKAADTVSWIEWKCVTKNLRAHLLQGARGTPSGILFFGITTCPVMLSGDYNRFTKFGLKSFLFRPTECGICSGGLPISGATTCPLCGFSICTRCAIKMALKTVDVSTAMSVLPCGKCRGTMRFSVLHGLDQLPMEESRFTKEEEEIIMDIIGIHDNPHENPLSEEDIKQIKEFEAKRNNEQPLQGMVDMTKCASCRQPFTSKRSKCSGCGKVAYCNSKCQRKHWKKEHKNVCKFMKTLHTGPQ